MPNGYLVTKQISYMLIAGVGKKSGSEICSLIFFSLSFLLPCFFLALKQCGMIGPSLSLSPDGCKFSISAKLNVDMRIHGTGRCLRGGSILGVRAGRIAACGTIPFWRQQSRHFVRAEHTGISLL